MALNYFWIFFFVVAFVIGLVKLIFWGDMTIFSEMMNSTFYMAKTSFEISLGLIGVLTLWIGIMKIGEKDGVVKIFSGLVGPFFNKLFPSIGKNHPAYGSIIMNIAVNMLNLDNAVTPMGLKAMKEMQETNTSDDTASDAQIMFLVLNVSGLTIIPISIMEYRTQLGPVNPSDIFIPILLATFFSTLTGLMAVAWHQKFNLLDKTILTYVGGLTAFIAGIIWYFSGLGKDQIQTISSVASSLFLFSIILSFIFLALRKKVNVYDAFIEGAKDGFKTAIMIIPYLIRITFRQAPGGMFGSDENSRMGYIDSRQGTETCGFAEQMTSDGIMTHITGDPLWADNCEDVLFISFTAAFTSDMKSLRYITCPNGVYN